MSESEGEVGRDQNGYLNCQQCSRRYLTLVGFDNHVKLEHSDLNLKQNKEKQDSNCVPNDVVYAKIPQKFQEDQESFLKKNLNSHQLEECKTLYGEKEVTLTIKKTELEKCPIIKSEKSDLFANINIFSYKCQECKKSFIQKQRLKDHINIVHKNLTPYQCQECKKYVFITVSRMQEVI